MSSKEYMGWIKYFKQRPFGWREDHRAAILSQTTYQGTKPLNINELFPSLKIMRESTIQKDLKLEIGFNKLKSLAKKSK
jgi:hypothetical protein